MKTKKYIISSLLSFTLLVGCAYSKSFSFTPKEPQWSFYGEGMGSYVSNMGRADQSSMWLSTDFGESETAFFTWKDLSPGNYKVITYVRALDVQKGSEGASFWHFYDGGYGTQSPFMDLSGSYDWRKVEYMVHVKASDLTIWFRLKSPGQVWIDDFYIEKVEAGQEKVSIENEKPLPVVQLNKLAPAKSKSAVKKKLYSFDSSESGHPFSIKNKAGEFAPQKFFNFKIDKMPVKNWLAYDRLEMDVFNPNDTYTDFYVTLADDKTTDYWSQDNFKQTLAPGWNKLSFSLTQYVGERGSHRFQRSINLAKLEKFFIVIDPDSKSTFASKAFLIDNISLSSNPMPVIPDGVMAFDFTSQKAEAGSNLNRVTSQTAYTDERGFGFVDPKFWRIEDSQYASEALRYSIGILDGHFRVKLPNGKYQMNLVVDKLGYWDVPFWSDRTVSINGTPVFKETRNSGKDFLADLLKFENIIPELQDNPYDLYLSKVFHSIDKTIDVTNGILDLEFKGDETGISLNSLILWNKKNEAEGLAYKKAFEKRNRDEFNWMSRSIQKTDKAASKLTISVVEPDLYLNPASVKKSSATQLSFLGGSGDVPYQVVQINSGNDDEKVSWSFGDFTNEKGEKVSQSQIALSDLVFQYNSPDINHETYMVTGKYLSPLLDHSYVIKKNHTKYLWLQLKINDKMPQGLFKGVIVFHNGSKETKIPVEINVLSYSLPKVEFPVGFFGIDPLPFTYFKGAGYSELRKKYRYLALDTLGEAGFTTFTGLPGDVSELDDLFKQSAKWGIQTVYSYGGQFPQSRIDLANKPGDMSEDAYYDKASSELKDLLGKKSWPKIVHTFSDEAGGYSDKIGSDIELAKKLKKHFPFMSLGGFGSFHGGDSNKLNAFFDYGFYSSLSKSDINKLKENNQRWGLYNASAGNLDDPRFSFGLGLYIARQNGLSQYLEWHATAANNYPYYDFDGRESDAVMFYPTTDGKLLHSLRFELATEGLHAYKKLKLIESAVANNSGNPAALKEAKAWLQGLGRENYFYSSTTFLSNKSVNFHTFEVKLNEQLKNLFSKK
ncbi:MAG: DUF4091 domain-containing protein [Rhizobacter sp.]|nr:DUF4091 domain-containing protein [Bacteriovorax sp.]